MLNVVQLRFSFTHGQDPVSSQVNVGIKDIVFSMVILGVEWTFRVLPIVFVITVKFVYFTVKKKSNNRPSLIL